VESFFKRHGVYFNKLCGKPLQYAPPSASGPLSFWSRKWCPSHFDSFR